MITLPRRSVTRFFIPMIDVLTLLFCIFLLMPFVEKEAGSGKLSPGEAAAQRRKIDELTRKLHEEGKESLAEGFVRREYIVSLTPDSRLGVVSGTVSMIPIPRVNVPIPGMLTTASGVTVALTGEVLGKISASPSVVAFGSVRASCSASSW